MSIIEAKNLTKTYGKARGITNLNLSVEEGDFFGFIGPNGAGKSTTIRTLLGFIRPTDGSATIFQQDIQSHRDSILSDIGYMPSEAMFYHGMQVQDILTLSAKLHKKDCRQESKELCHRLDLDVHKKIEELSLGNRKVSLHGITTLPDTIQGTSVQKDGDTINFLYSGDIKPLLEQLSPLPLQDVLITEPDLEEVFLHYYKEERS